MCEQAAAPSPLGSRHSMYIMCLVAVGLGHRMATSFGPSATPAGTSHRRDSAVQHHGKRNL